MKEAKWGSLPILDAFRPEPGWKTDHAVFGSYSADPIALVAVLLALAGRDDDKGSGTLIDFADAIENLRGKVAFLIQSGRISVPFRGQTVLKVLDSFVREIDCDESVESWHPKVALIRQLREQDQMPCWRFWMGSRNLTRDRSWDAGFLIVGSMEKQGKPVPGLIEAANVLWSKAGLGQSDKESMANELSRAHWIHPPGCRVEEIQFLHPKLRVRELPERPRRVESLLVVSPFLDGGTVRKLSDWGGRDIPKTLLSTQNALSALAKQKNKPLRHYSDVLCMAYVEEDESLFIPFLDEDAESISDEAGEEHAGLHAKLILACHKKRATLWLGSPNATERAWKRNYEIIARLSLEEKLAGDLIRFSKTATEFVDDSKPEPISEAVEVLENARKEVVCRWQVRQKNWTLYADTLPHPDHPKVSLEVGVLGGDLVKWPRRVKILPLKQSKPPIEAEFIQVRISLGKDERRWLQKAALDPPPDADRDRRAVATLLSPHTFLKWLRSILDDLPTSDGEQWDRESSSSKNYPIPKRWLPALEDILKAWACNPAALKIVDARMKAYMDFIRTSSGDHGKEMGHLEEFEKVWEIIRRELLEKE